MRKLLLLFITFSFFNVYSQNIKLTPSAEVSIITCGPGTELYAAFGHSAFRVRDTKLGIDRVYNYGVFDFDQPNFYGNFAKGNLLYFLGKVDTNRFLRVYYLEKRWVKGQVLDLEINDTQKIFDFLESNAKPENREYLYDYFYNNCSTKLYDVIKEVLGEKLIISETKTDNPLSHRELMQLYLGNQPWGDFGIDVCLGSTIDDTANAQEYLFLPENVFNFFNTLRITEDAKIKPIVKRTEIILPETKKETTKTWLTPLLLFAILGLLVIAITIKNIKSNKRSKWLDFGIYFITGVIGLVITLIWFATNHESAKNNFNVLWAFAPNLVVSFYLLKNKLPSWIKKYNLWLLILLVLSLLIWIVRIQVLSIAVLPIIIFLGIRYFYLWKFN